MFGVFAVGGIFGAAAFGTVGLLLAGIGFGVAVSTGASGYEGPSIPLAGSRLTAWSQRSAAGWDFWCGGAGGMMGRCLILLLLPLVMGRRRAIRGRPAGPG